MRLLATLSVIVFAACEWSIQLPDNPPGAYYVVASADDVAGCYELTLSSPSGHEPSKTFHLPTHIELTLTSAVQSPVGDVSHSIRAYRIEALGPNGQSGVWMIPVPGLYQLEWNHTKPRLFAHVRRVRQTGDLRGFARAMNHDGTGVVDQRILQMRRVACASRRQTTNGASAAAAVQLHVAAVAARLRPGSRAALSSVNLESHGFGARNRPRD